MIDSPVAEGLLLLVYQAGGLKAMYVTFSWAKEHDRRNPRRCHERLPGKGGY